MGTGKNIPDAERSKTTCVRRPESVPWPDQVALAPLADGQVTLGASLHFTGAEAEAQRDRVLCPRAPAWVPAVSLSEFCSTTHSPCDPGKSPAVSELRF